MLKIYIYIDQDHLFIIQSSDRTLLLVLRFIMMTHQTLIYWLLTVISIIIRSVLTLIVVVAMMRVFLAITLYMTIAPKEGLMHMVVLIHITL
jgi:hypothetical protein